jgi:hypothetical protein
VSRGSGAVVRAARAAAGNLVVAKQLAGAERLEAHGADPRACASGNTSRS